MKRKLPNIKRPSIKLPSFRQLRSFIWRRQTLYFVALSSLFSVVVWQLSALPSSAALTERELVTSTSSLSAIIDNPLSLPYKLIAYLVNIFSDSVRVIRALSILLFGASVVALYRILKRWHSDRIALLASAMYAANATGLIVGRLASPTVLLLGWSLFISVMLWVQHGKSKRIAPALLVIVGGFLMYIPGALYYFILFGILFYKKIQLQLLKFSPRSLAIILGAFLVFVSPLVWASIQDLSVIKAWLLLPETIDWNETVRNVLRVPSAYIYRSPDNPLFGVGRLPVLDVAVGGMFLVGMYAYQRYAKLERTKVMLMTALLAIVIGALGQVIEAIVLLLPFVYAVVAAGMSYLLDEWYRVFPNNPFARNFGMLLIVFVVSMSMYYQLIRFLVVWPNTPETRDVYNQSRLVIEQE